MVAAFVLSKATLLSTACAFGVRGWHLGPSAIFSLNHMCVCQQSNSLPVVFVSVAGGFRIYVGLVALSDGRTLKHLTVIVRGRRVLQSFSVECPVKTRQQVRT